MSVLSLDEAKAHLNITGNSSDAEIQSVIDTAEAAITARIGPLAAAGSTVRVAGGGSVLFLPSAPVSNVTSVTPNDGTAALDLTLLTVNASSGTVEYSGGGMFTAPAYDVVFTSGWSSIPADILFAIKELVRHLWTTQRGGSGRPGSGAVDQAAPGYLIPNRVAELLEPHRVPGIA